MNRKHVTFLLGLNVANQWADFSHTCFCKYNNNFIDELYASIVQHVS